jgi:capsular polysaccharide biosynthesis protein
MTEQLNPRDSTAAERTPAELEMDAPVDLRRVSSAIRRSGRLVLAIVLLVTGLVLAVSLLSPAHYRASARIADDPAVGEGVDIATADRQLATGRELVTAPAVLAGAARHLPGETVETLDGSVTAKVDPTASILDVVVTGRDPARVARVANAVAAAFIAESERVERLAAARAREGLADEVERLRKAGAPGTTLEPMRERLSDLAVSEVTSDSGLRLVERAVMPSVPYAPRPLRSALLACFAALLLAVLIAVARDRLRPPVPDARTLSWVVGLPLIAALPPARENGPLRSLRGILGHRRRASTAVDQTVIEEAALQAAVRGALPPRGQRVVLVHSIDEYDGAAQVAAGLARALAWSGHATVLVRFEAPDGRAQPTADFPTLGCTDIDEQLDELKRTDYRYVVVQSPRAARGTRLRQLAARPTAVVLVARLGVATTADGAAARRLVDALGLRGLGLVVICAPGEGPPIARADLTVPRRSPARPRGGSQNGPQNGAHAPAAAAAIGAEPGSGPDSGPA